MSLGPVNHWRQGLDPEHQEDLLMAMDFALVAYGKSHSRFLSGPKGTLDQLASSGRL